MENGSYAGPRRPATFRLNVAVFVGGVKGGVISMNGGRVDALRFLAMIEPKFGARAWSAGLVIPVSTPTSWPTLFVTVERTTAKR